MRACACARGTMCLRLTWLLLFRPSPPALLDLRCNSEAFHTLPESMPQDKNQHYPIAPSLDLNARSMRQIWTSTQRSGSNHLGLSQDKNQYYPIAPSLDLNAFVCPRYGRSGNGRCGNGMKQVTGKFSIQSRLTSSCEFRTRPRGERWGSVGAERRWKGCVCVCVVWVRGI